MFVLFKNYPYICGHVLAELVQLLIFPLTIHLSSERTMVSRGGKSRRVVWFGFSFFYDAVNVVFVVVKCFNEQKRGVKIF